MDRLFIPIFRYLDEEQIRNAITHVGCDSHSNELDSGSINMVSNLQFYPDDPFVLAVSEIHVPWEIRRNRWKVVVVVAFNLDGGNFHFLHMKVAWKDVEDALHEGLSIVLDTIRQLGYARRLMGIICNGCPAKLLAKVNGAREFPVLWNYTHLRKTLAHDYRIVDFVLKETYHLQFNANDWRDTVYLPVDEDVHGPIAREVREVKLLVGRICSYPATPFTTLRMLNCNDLELCCTVIISWVKKVVDFMPQASWEEFEQNRHRFIAHLVGVAEQITDKPDPFFRG